MILGETTQTYPAMTQNFFNQYHEGREKVMKWYYIFIIVFIWCFNVILAIGEAGLWLIKPLAFSAMPISIIFFIILSTKMKAMFNFHKNPSSAPNPLYLNNSAIWAAIIVFSLASALIIFVIRMS